MNDLFADHAEKPQRPLEDLRAARLVRPSPAQTQPVFPRDPEQVSTPRHATNDRSG